MNGKWGFSVGMPTDVDVRRLVDQFGTPGIMTLIPYADLEGCLKMRRDQLRFRTVTAAWRKKLEREHNLMTVAVPNEGFRVLDNPGRVDSVSRLYKHGLRRIMKSGERALRTPDNGLTAEQRRARDFVGSTAGTIKLQAAIEARRMRELPPVSA